MTRDPSKPKSRWLPWMVVLGMFVVLVVLPFGVWLAVQSRRVSQFRQAVGAIEALGGGVEIGEQDRGPEWLRSLLGEHFFARAEWVWYPSGASDEDLIHLRCLPGVLSLDLVGTRVTDAGLAEVARLRGLEGLGLSGTPITDAGVTQLLALEQLYTLDLNYTVVTDEGLQALARLPALEDLILVDTRVTKGGASRFAAARPDVSLTWRTAPSETHRRAAVALLRSGAHLHLDTQEGTVEQVGTSVYIGDYELYDSGPGDPPDFSNLEKLDDLWSLTVYGGSLEAADLDVLGRLHQLERLSFYAIGDGDLAHLGSLKSLEWLDLGGTQVTDAGLKHLKGLESLESLLLCETAVTDAGLEHLQSLVSLAEVDLSYTGVTGPGLAHLKGLTSCNVLRLSGTPLTDEGFAHIEALQSLDSLDVSETQITDAGLVHLKTLTNLENLALVETQISDAGLVHLKALTNLENLALGGTQITDAGLVHLEGLVKLRDLQLWGTDVTDKAVEKLDEALPNVILADVEGEEDYGGYAASMTEYEDDGGEIIEEDEEAAERE
jgi:Leucine-rich repeat (LRR) protein